MITRQAVTAFFCFAFCASLLVGCASPGPAKLYEGPVLPESQIARITCERHTNQAARFCPTVYQDIFISKLNGDQVKPYGFVKDAYLMPGAHDLVFELVLQNGGSVQSQGGGLVGALVAAAANVAIGAMIEKQKAEGRGSLTLCAAMGEKYTVRFYQRGSRASYWIERDPDGLLVAGERAGPLFYNSLGTDALVAKYRDEKDEWARTDMLDNSTNQTLQLYAAENDPDDDLRDRAVRSVMDQTVLARIARNESETYGVRGEAIVKLETPIVLEELATCTNTQGVQRVAKFRLKYLSKQADSEETRSECKQAINRLVEAKKWK